MSDENALFDCKSDDSTCQIEYAITVTLLALLFALLAWYFPIKDTTGAKNKALSILLAVLLFPVYLVILAIQYPYIDANGNEQAAVTLLLALFFWPALFFVIDTKRDERVGISKEGDFV